MARKSLRIRIPALGLSLAIVAATSPFSFAQAMSASPLGSLITAGNVAIGNVSAPTGTMIFNGDKVSSNQTSAIQFNSGSRIAMARAAATFDRDGEMLVVKADKGLLSFNFAEGESVRIEAAGFVFTGNGENAVAGELAVNQAGQLVMNVSEGVLMALNTATSARTMVTAQSNVDNTPQVTGGTVVHSGLSGAEKAALVAGIAGAGVIIGIGVYNARKSPNSR